VGFHNVPEAAFRRRLEEFPHSAQQEVAQRATDLLSTEGNASHNEQLLMDEARAFVNGLWNFQASNRAVTFWRLGQLIVRRAYHHDNALSPIARNLWDFLATYRYPSRHDDDIEDATEGLGESINTLGDLAPSGNTSSSSGSSSGGSSSHSSSGGGFWSGVADFFTGIGD
jgi:uncharacterized membrane protein YgcG